MEVAKTIYSGVTAHRIAIGSGMLVMASCAATALVYRMRYPQPQARERAYHHQPPALTIFLSLLPALSTGAFLYRWHHGLCALSLADVGLRVALWTGALPSGPEGQRSCYHIVASAGSGLQYFVVIGQLSLFAGSLAMGSRWWKGTVVSVACIGQVANLLVSACVLLPVSWKEATR
jgi:hypothetical protein